MKSDAEYKELSIREFTKAAEVYDSNHAVICANSFHHYPNPQAFFDEVARVLRPGGKLFAATFGKNVNNRLAVFAW